MGGCLFQFLERLILVESAADRGSEASGTGRHGREGGAENNKGFLETERKQIELGSTGNLMAPISHRQPHRPVGLGTVAVRSALEVNSLSRGFSFFRCRLPLFPHAQSTMNCLGGTVNTHQHAVLTSCRQGRCADASFRVNLVSAHLQCPDPVREKAHFFINSVLVYIYNVVRAELALLTG